MDVCKQLTAITKEGWSLAEKIGFKYRDQRITVAKVSVKSRAREQFSNLFVFRFLDTNKKCC